MAFDTQYLVLLAHGNDKKLWYYDADANSETLATVAASGYFNNTDDDVRLSADDLITVKGTDGVTTFEVTSVSSGSVSTRDIRNRALHTGSTASNLLPGVNLLAGTTAGTHNLPVPTAGDSLLIIGTGAASHVISSTASISLGSTGATTITLGGIGSGVELLAASSTQYLVLRDIESTTGSGGYTLS